MCNKSPQSGIVIYLFILKRSDIIDFRHPDKVILAGKQGTNIRAWTVKVVN